MNVFKVNDKLYRGSRPEFGGDFVKLKEMGITQILNLERGYFELFHGKSNYETMQTLTWEMNPIRIELGDIIPPTLEEILTCVLLIKAHQDITGSTFVHCAKGVDRTGEIIGAYRIIVDGWTIDDAIKEMIKMGMHKIYQIFWLPHFRKIMSQI